MKWSLLPNTMSAIYPRDGPVLTKWHFVSVIIFRNKWSGVYDFLLSKSSILPRHRFPAHSHRLSVSALTKSDCKGATCLKRAHTHTSVSQGWYARHASTTPENDLYPFSGLSFPQWRSPSGAQNLWNSNPPTPRKLASAALSILPNRVKRRNTSGCWGGQTAAEVVITLWCGTPKSAGHHNQVYVIMLSHFKGRILVWSTQERGAFTAGSLTSAEALPTAPLSIIYIRTK